jgi:outer membrane protein OmpA-like peptidoglycan-associated protein
MNRQKQWLFEAPSILETSPSGGDAMAGSPNGKGGKSKGIDRATLGKRVTNLRAQVLAARKQAGAQQNHCRDQINRFDVAWRRIVTSLQQSNVPAFTLARQVTDLESRTAELLACLGFSTSSSELNPEFEWETEWELQEGGSPALGEEEWERSPTSLSRRTIRETVSGFSRYSNVIPLQERAKIARIAQLIVQSHRTGRPIRTVQLVGHADRDVQRGANFEKKISGDRALSIQKALIQRINNQTISSQINWQRVAAGASQRVVQNPTTEQARSRNRRVILVAKTEPNKGQPSPPKWTANFLSITIRKARVPDCLGAASPSFRSLLSQKPNCVGTCGGPIREHFQIFFHVDDSIVSRPQPFQPPKVSVELEVLTPGGSSKFSKVESDAKPIYKGPGEPLETSFGKDFKLPIEPGDILRVNLRLEDGSSGVSVVYSDQINVVKLRCS